MATAIEWTDETWNPTVGCSVVSPGCTNCYAMKMAGRLEAMGQERYADLTRKVNGNTVWTGEVRCVEKALELPARWQKPRRVFVNSMSDLFHEGIPFRFVARVFGTMHNYPQHTFQILTKRPERMLEFIARYRREWLGKGFEDAFPREYGHVWLGVSAEDQRRADERIPLLLRTPAAVRFVSAEPLLGPLDLSNWLRYAGCANGGRRCELTGGPACRDGCFPLDWLIVGGESGPGARPCDLRWIRSLAEQCRAGGVACFVKQLGARPVGMAWKIRDRKGGDWDEWTDDLRVRDFPEPCHAA